MASLLELVAAAAERDEVQAYGRHLLNTRSELTEEDRQLELAVLFEDPKLETSWLLEHARVILEAHHRDVFGQSSDWVRKLTLVDSVRNHFNLKRPESLVRNGRAVIRALYCCTDPEQPKLRGVRMLLATAISGKLTEDERAYCSPLPSNFYNKYGVAAALLLEHGEGPGLAKRYYSEVHGIVASFEVEEVYDEEEGDIISRNWMVSLDVGAVDEAAHRLRVAAGKKRKLRETLLEGPRRQKVAGDRNVVCTTLACKLGQVVPPVVARVRAFLSLEDSLRQHAFMSL